MGNGLEVMKSLSFGEVLWDIIDGKEYLGGAPFNLAAHLAKLDCESYMISRVGNDSRGSIALKEMLRLGVNSSFVQIDQTHSTGTVNATIMDNGIPSYIINEDVAYDFIDKSEIISGYFSKIKLDVFCFGSLTQRSNVSRDTIYSLLELLKPGDVFYDVNLRQNYYSKEIITKSLSYSSIVKLNIEEVEILSELLYGQKMSERIFADKATSDYKVQIVCITKGSEGCSIFHEGKCESILGIKRRYYRCRRCI